MPQLYWQGKEQLFQEVTEQIRRGPTREKLLPDPPFLIYGDVVCAAPRMASELYGRVKLVYMDPPFGTGDSFSHKGRRGRKGSRVIYDDPADADAYLSFMYPVLLSSHAMLAAGGSVYVHLDHRMEHLVRILLDEIFGPGCFRSMVVWKRDPGGKGAKARSRQWPRNIDVLLWYSKSPDSWDFSMEWRQLTDGQKRAYRYTEPDGRRYKAVQLGDYSEKSISELEARGLIHVSRTGRKYRKYYLDGAKSPVDAIWDDIPGFGTRTASGEYTGYPTQKPLSLLERIIRAHTQPGDLVADLFMGSGTTAVAASTLGRRWVGVEKSREGIDVTLHRLGEAGEQYTSPVSVITL